MPTEPRCFVLAKATLALYALDSDGNPIASPAVWADAKAEDLKLNSRYIYVNHKPTGARYNRRKPVDEIHEIAVGRLWEARFNPASPTSDADVPMERGARYALVITWIDERPNSTEDAWARRIYYGVTCDGFDVTSRDLFESEDHRTFTADFFRASNGKGTPTAI
jgi:hypothetical protein